MNGEAGGQQVRSGRGGDWGVEDLGKALAEKAALVDTRKWPTATRHACSLPRIPPVLSTREYAPPTSMLPPTRHSTPRVPSTLSRVHGHAMRTCPTATPAAA